MIESDSRLYRVERWKDENLDVPLWHARSDHMVALLKRYLAERGEDRRPLRLLELGCGAMAAERSLARHGLDRVEYVPADCFPRDPRTVVIDLDRCEDLEQLPRADVGLLGGVLEYLADPIGVLRALAARCRYLFFSYCPRTSDQSPAARKGWKNHFTGEEMERIAESLGERAIVDASFEPRAPKPVRTYFVAAGDPAARARGPARCPLCRGADSEVAHVGLLPLRGERIFQETCVCRGCGLTFEVAAPDQDWASLYGDVWQRGALPSAEQRALYANDARVIGPGRGARVFEIGCGSGLLLDELARAGWRTAGCDPEQAAVAIAREKGHDVRAELFEPRAELRSRLVILGDVLEHQADPRSMLAQARAIVAPGGGLYLRVPDLEALDGESFGDVFGLQHRVWFTRDTLREMLAVEGFEVLRTGPFARGMHALARLCERRAWRRPAGEPERSLAHIRSYASGLETARAAVAARLEALAGREVALYGGGEHAQELLCFTPLGRIASRVVDGNPALWGRSCAGLRIESPDSLRAQPPRSIVIASRAYQDEIARALSDLARRGVEIVSLYGESA